MVENRQSQPGEPHVCSIITVGLVILVMKSIPDVLMLLKRRSIYGCLPCLLKRLPILFSCEGAFAILSHISMKMLLADKGQ